MAEVMKRDSDSESSLDLDTDGSSSFDEFDYGDSQLGVQPYMFEPEIDSDEEYTVPNPTMADSECSSQEERLGNSNWCTCGHCSQMPTVSESLCCHEIQKVMAVLEKDPGKECITEHNGFHPVCLHPSVLRTAYHVYRSHYEEIPESNGRMRYISYRQLVRWCWGWLGSQVRVPLPACAVSLIRCTYPEENGQYHGFTPF